MHWLEQALHISPDGGNGFTELATMVSVALAMNLFYWLSRRSRHDSRGCKNH